MPGLSKVGGTGNTDLIPNREKNSTSQARTETGKKRTGGNIPRESPDWV